MISIFLLIGLAVLLGGATLAYAAGWIGPKEPNWTAIRIAQHTEWMKKVENLVGGASDGHRDGSSRRDG